MKQTEKDIDDLFAEWDKVVADTNAKVQDYFADDWKYGRDERVYQWYMDGVGFNATRSASENGAMYYFDEL